jgi:hypothetical protein
MKIQLNKIRATTVEQPSSCDFRRRQFKKSPNRAEKEGYAKETIGVLAWQQ